MITEGTVVCGATAAECKCDLPRDHPMPHECKDQDRCGGAWVGEFDTATFDVIRYPGPVALGLLGG